MWLQNPLDDILSSATKVAVLRAVFRANSPLSGREIIRRAGVTYGSGWKALQRLVASGVLSKRDHGRVNTFELRCPGLPLVQRLRDLFAAENRRQQDAIADMVEGVPETVSVILFGSEARGEAKAGSDTDLLLVVAQKGSDLEGRILDVCMQVAEKHDLAVSWHVADFEQIRDWEATGHEFWRNVLKDGVVLHGGPLEALRRRWQHGEAT